MKSSGTIYWTSPNTAATNESGFSALPGGYRHVDGNFYNIRYNAFFWSATENAFNFFVWFRSLTSEHGVVTRHFHIYDIKSNGESVRCLRD